MPIYEYECETCHHHFEVQQKFADPPIETCRQCGKGVRKIISAPGLMFKGTGWYVTDYSNKLKDPAAAQKEKGEGSAKGDAGHGEPSKNAPAKSESGSTADSSSSSSTSAPSGSTGSGSTASDSTAKPVPRKPTPS